MLSLPIKDIIVKIKEETGLSEDEIQNQIKIKLQSLDGLVSEEGAAYIVASDLGVRLFKDLSSGALKIKNILVGMNNVEVIGRVVSVRQPITFTRNDKTSEVGSIMISDDTGSIKVVIWDNRVEWIKDGKLGEGVIVKIKDAYTKENTYSGKELHLNNRSILMINPEGVDLPASTIKNKAITDLSPQEKASLLATVVRVFRPRFYTSCSKCGKKAEETDEGYVCPEHKITEPRLQMVLNLILDDGTETIRSVAFGESAERLTSLKAEEAQEILTKDGEVALVERLEEFLLGRVIDLKGRMHENKAFDRTEFQISRSILNPDPRAIALNLLRGEKSA